MVQYHVDTCEMLQNQMNKETKHVDEETGCKECKMFFFIFGYDDAIFKQYLLTKKNWVGLCRETAISQTMKDWE